GSGGSNTYTKDADVTNVSLPTGVRTLVFSAPVTHALSGGTITVTFPSPTPFDKAVTVFYFNGIASPSPADQVQTATGNSALPNSGNTPTTTQADELLIGAIGFNNRTANI